MPDHGTDVRWNTDVSPEMTEVSGRELLIADLAKRFETPTGSMYPFDPLAQDDGYDLRFLLNESTPNVGMTEARIAAECLKDDRVEEAEVTITASEDESEFFVVISVDDGDGPFDFTLSVTAIGVDIITKGV